MADPPPVTPRVVGGPAAPAAPSVVGETALPERPAGLGSPPEAIGQRSQEPTPGLPKRKRRGAKAAVYAAVFVVIFAALYVNDNAAPGPSWEGGTWTSPATVPVYGLENYVPDLYDIGGEVHMVVPFVSSQHGMHGGNTSSDYATWDTRHFVRDGEAWKEQPAFSAFDDDTSTGVWGFVQYAGRTLAVRSSSTRLVRDETRSGNDRINWNQSVDLVALNGTSLDHIVGIGGPETFGGNQDGPALFPFAGKLFLFWRNDTTGADNASTMRWRVFDGDNLSEVRSAELPTVRGYVVRYLPREGELLVGYIGRNSTSEPASLALARFDGDGFVPLATATADLDVGAREWGTATDLGASVVFTWERGGEVFSRTYDGAALSPVQKVATGSLGGAFLSNGRAYCIYVASRGLVFSSHEGRIVSFDGTRWGSPYPVTGPITSAQGFPSATALKGGIWISMLTQVNEGWTFTLRMYAKSP